MHSPRWYVASVVVPLRLTEPAPKHIGGGLTSLQLLVTVGIFPAAARSPRQDRCRQEGSVGDTAVTVTLLSHSAKEPSFSPTWCAPDPGRPTTSVGYTTGSEPDSQ